MATAPVPSRSTERRGVLAAGHWIMDRVCLVGSWPEQDTVALISGETAGNGGGAYNVLKDLARLECDFPLFASGLIGEDGDGRAMIEDCAAHCIDTARLRRRADAPTSYCHVITATDTSRRTFFHQKGANKLFAPEHVDLRSSSARIFYLGYLGMLEEMDRMDDGGRTGASRLFQEAQELGMITVADLCSNPRDDMASIVAPSLPYLDYLFLNEFEASQLTGTKAMPHPELKWLIEQGREILNRGVRKGVIIHVPAGVACVQRDGPTVTQGSVRVPESQVRGTAGAGDALAAGFVLALHEGQGIEKALQLAVCSAAASLGDPLCSASIPNWKTCLASGQAFGFRDFN